MKQKTLQQLKEFVDGLGNVEKLEILPYHTMGVYKWEHLGLAYPLKGYHSPSEEEIKQAEDILQPASF